MEVGHSMRAWLIFERKDFDKVMASRKYDSNKIISANVNGKFIEAYYEGDNKFHQVKILRHVLAPYVKDGEPRGWFKGKDGEPLRWTGISNIFYLGGDGALEAFHALLDALAMGMVDSKYMVEIEENGEKFIGFCPKKLNNL